jgi:hypothetical protein
MVATPWKLRMVQIHNPDQAEYILVGSNGTGEVTASVHASSAGRRGSALQGPLPGCRTSHRLKNGNIQDVLPGISDDVVGGEGIHHSRSTSRAGYSSAREGGAQ